MAKIKIPIPAGYNAYCVLCNKGFKFFDGLADHNIENVEEHKRRSGKKDKPKVTESASAKETV